MKYIFIVLFMGLVSVGYAQNVQNGGKGKLTAPVQRSDKQLKGIPVGRTSNTSQQGTLKGTNTTGATSERQSKNTGTGNGINSTTGQKRVEHSPKTSDK